MTAHAKNARRKQIHVLVNEEELNQVEANAKRAGLGKGAFLRERGMGHGPLTRIDQDRVDALGKINADLGRIGGLLKWWLSEADMIRAGRVPRARLEETLDDIRVTQKRMREAISALSKKIKN